MGKCRPHLGLVVTGPLNGITVLDLSMFIAGPFGTMLLADLGAEVIKVEPPSGDPVRSNRIGPQVRGENAQFHSYNRNKKSIVLDLKNEHGLAVFEDLVGTADVVFDNFRPGVLERLKLDHDRLSRINPAIISCSVSAFGQTGPWAKRAGYDLTVQALGGGHESCGAPGDRAGTHSLPPWRHRPAGCSGRLGSLPRSRSVTGPARAAESMSRCSTRRLLSLVTKSPTMSRAGDVVRRFMVPGIPISSPISRLRRPTNLSLSRPSASRNIGSPSALPLVAGIWRRITRYSSNAARVAHRDVLEPEVAAALMMKTRTELGWTVFEDADVPAAPIQTVGEAVAAPQAVAREMVAMTEVAGATVAMAGNPVKFDGDETQFVPAPVLGADQNGVLAERLGL